MGCLLLDLIIAATVLQTGTSPTQPWQYLFALVLIIGVTILEFMGLNRIWPPEPLE